MTSCPDRRLLKQLLAEQLGDAERLAAEGHVEACSTCQEVLQALADLAETSRWRRLYEGSSSADSLSAASLGRLTDESVGAPHVLPTVEGYDILGELGRGGTG